MSNKVKKTNNTKTCFVMIGYGKRTYLVKKKTLRKINLDKTYSEIIEKTFEELRNEGYNVHCFRSIEKNSKSTGSIDKQMYEDIYESDLVIADISTLNANVMYELGIRHALKPHTTIVMCENKTVLPFDINSIVVDFYQCEEDGILTHVRDEIVENLKTKIRAILDSKEIKNDSPVHEYLEGISVQRKRGNPKFVMEKTEEQSSLSFFIDEAEKAKNREDYRLAISFIKKALEIDKNDVYLLQRLVLLTYKSKDPDELSALKGALKLLDEELQYDQSIDPETLGLSGAVCKRIAEIANDRELLDEAINCYQKGYVLLKDYYNGINLAFLYVIRAAYYRDNSKEGFQEALLDYNIGKRIRKEIKELCTSMTESEDFEERSDRSWIYLTLAEVHFIEDELEQESQMIERAEASTEGTFNLSSYKEQRSKLTAALKLYNTKKGVDKFGT
ncbi:MAG: TRAFs-binding domain-containing protein [Crocinitomicaceae bacterium]